MIVTFQNRTLDHTASPWLLTAEAAARLYDADRDMFMNAFEASLTDWQPTYRHLSDTRRTVTPDRDDWAWLLDEGWRMLPLTAPPTAPTCADMARTLTTRMNITDAGLAALSLAAAARQARRSPRAWSLALLQTRPRLWHAGAQWDPGLNPMLGWHGRWCSAELIEGVTGPALACALATVTLQGGWDEPEAVGPGGRRVRIDARAWRLLDEHGWRGAVVPDPSCEF